MVKSIFTFALVFSLTFITYGSVEKSKKLKSKIQLSYIELRTIEKNIRLYQEETISIEDKILQEKSQLQAIKTESSQEGQTNLFIDKEIVIAELSILDEDSLESISEQDFVFENLKKTYQKRDILSEKEKLSLRKTRQLSSKLKELLLIQKNVQKQLGQSQRKKVLLVASINEYKDELLKLEDFNLVEEAISKVESLESKVNHSLGRKFQAPILEYASYSSEEKGMRFKCYLSCSLVNPATGFIIHKGELAPYGKIMIISHADEVRSVFLGDFSTKLQKGAKVYKGDIIGKTIEENLGSIYFELRKSNQPIDILSKISNL